MRYLNTHTTVALGPAILVLAAVCLALAGLVFKSQSALASIKPLIIRINDVGRAEACLIALAGLMRETRT